MSESVYDTRLGGIVWRHLHFYSITDRKANEAFAHFAGDMRKNEMVVRKRDAKHGPREHRHDGALYYDSFFRIYHVHFRVALANNAASKSEAALRNYFLFYRRKPAKERRSP